MTNRKRANFKLVSNSNDPLFRDDGPDLGSDPFVQNEKTLTFSTLDQVELVEEVLNIISNNCSFTEYLSLILGFCSKYLKAKKLVLVCDVGVFQFADGQLNPVSVPSDKVLAAFETNQLLGNRDLLSLLSMDSPTQVVVVPLQIQNGLYGIVLVELPQVALTEHNGFNSIHVRVGRMLSHLIENRLLLALAHSNDVKALKAS